MATLRNYDLYKWYQSKSGDELHIHLPEIGQDADGDYEIFLGELFCRAPGCNHTHKFRTTNALRKHYEAAHPELDLSGASQGGRPSITDQNASLEFYKYLKQVWDEQHGSDLPPLPRKRDRTVNLTQMRNQVRDMGYDIPCDTCRAARRSGQCCQVRHRDTCDHYELFADDD